MAKQKRKLIEKLLFEVYDKGVQQQDCNLTDYYEKIKQALNIPVVVNSFYFDCWKRDGKIQTKIIKALNIKDAELLFKAKYPEHGYDKPY